MDGDAFVVTSGDAQLADADALRMAQWLKRRPFLALSAGHKARILAFLVNELLQNKAVIGQIEQAIDGQNTARRYRSTRILPWSKDAKDFMTFEWCFDVLQGSLGGGQQDQKAQDAARQEEPVVAVGLRRWRRHDAPERQRPGPVRAKKNSPFLKKKQIPQNVHSLLVKREIQRISFFKIFYLNLVTGFQAGDDSTTHDEGGAGVKKEPADADEHADDAEEDADDDADEQADGQDEVAIGFFFDAWLLLLWNYC